MYTHPQPPLSFICVALAQILWWVVPCSGWADVDFQRDVQPILTEHCFQCHGPDNEQRQADLRLDRRDNAIEVLSPQHPDESELLRRIVSSDADEQMPPPDHGRLSDTDIATLRQWIESGASYVVHWSFVAPQRPHVPQPENENSVSPIDCFVDAKIAEKKLSRSPQASDETLVRRLSFDLRGIPPSVREIEEYLADINADKYPRLVDTWLTSPAFGERLAQDWLDAARYADTTGHAADVPRQMWLFRDWVITAINADMPFDQFTIEQIAGDMLPNATLSQQIATGFHRNSMQALGNNPRKEEFRVKGIVDRLDTTGRVWLGLTLACAECHDHKYDPISTREYYQLFAVFNNVPHYGERFQIHGPRLKLYTPELRERKAKWEQETDELEQALKQAKESAENQEQPEETPSPEITNLSTRLKQARAELKKVENETPTAQVMEELSEPRKTFIHVRGNFEVHGDQVWANTPSFLPPAATTDQTVNRVAFAEWLVSPSHPLTARVAVNRLWAHFFGRGIVATLDDFGVRGDLPSHPDLLDWLAMEYIESGWNTKRLVREIVMSSVYRQASQRTSPEDPDNQWLTRGPRHRLAAEQMRDNALAISGLLDLRIGGQSVYPDQPEGVGEFRDLSAGEWLVSGGGDRYRKGLYTFWQRMSPYPSLLMFDAPTRERSCVRRSRTNTPLQALALLNDPEYVAMANAFAQRIMASHETFSRRLEFAFRTAVGRKPDAVEQQAFFQFLQANNTPRSVAGNTRAWQLAAQVLLNLDETISKQ